MSIEDTVREKLRQTVENVYAKQVVGARRTHRDDSEMETIFDGVLELKNKRNRFEASVHTERGHKILTGTLNDAKADIQSGRSFEWEAGIERVSHAIKEAYDEPNAVHALSRISKIWDSIEKSSELAAARSRILLNKVDTPDLGELPCWYLNQMNVLGGGDDDEITANRYAVESAELLLRTLNHQFAETLPNADLYVGLLGRVVIDWHLAHGRLQWMVDANDLPWPSLKIYEVFCELHPKAQLKCRSRILHNVFEAVKSLKVAASD